MPNYRRYRIPGGCYFFTVNLLERNNTLLVDHIDLLRESIRLCKQKHPFHIDAWVVLPEHLHCIWTLPGGNDDFSNRWKIIKKHFSKGLPKIERRSQIRLKRGERGICSVVSGSMLFVMIETMRLIWITCILIR
jgi:putative transposase